MTTPNETRSHLIEIANALDIANLPSFKNAAKWIRTGAEELRTLNTRLAELERIVEGPVKELWKRATENGHVYCDTQAQPMYLTREACIAAQKGKS